MEQILNSDHLNELSIRFYQNKQYEEAHQCASLLCQIEPIDARSYKTLGVVNQGWGKYSWAIGAYKRALIFGFDDAQTMFYLGQCYAQLHQYKQAQGWLKASLKANPHDEKTSHLLKVISQKVC